MVVPYRHESDLNKLPTAEMNDLSAMTQMAVKALTEFYAPQGINIGMNLGAAAGAGIREHLHMHIVPRWMGDTNFMPVIGETKSMPQHLLDSYDKLFEALKRI
jgi:ATP adenylyltransferase